MCNGLYALELSQSQEIGYNYFTGSNYIPATKEI